MKYHIITFGCESNKADSERIVRKLELLGHTKAKTEKDAGIIVINACSVRKSAIDRVYAKINQFKSKQIILAGCILESDKKKFKNNVSEIWHPDEYFDLIPIPSSKFSAFVPIMTGCNNFCTYCAVPFTRGREKSRKAKDIISEVGRLVNEGYKEIWLLGQNVNSYGPGKKNFPELLREINKIPGEFWIRFVSPHPKDFSDDLIRTVKECSKITKYINLPVQSGDNEILKKMNRRYTREHYIKLVKKIRRMVPDVALSTDTIVGFPGETRKQFLNSVKLYKELGFDMGFIARYSPRPGTASALTMTDDVSHKEKKRRWQELTNVLRKTALHNNKKLLGTTQKVLIDSAQKGCFFGRTEGNKVIKLVDVQLQPVKIGDFVRVKITKAGPWMLEGTLAKQKIIVVLGPTSSGKSDLAVEIAQKFNGEIISADSRQVYKKLDIGSGKVTKHEMGGINHYLLDVVEPKKIFTANDFKKEAEKAILEIAGKNKIPVVCGGTGFYIHALLNNPVPEVAPDWTLRKKLEKNSSEELFKMLKKLDGLRAKTIDVKNKRRLIRAIEICKKIGSVPKPNKQSLKYDVLYIGINRPEKNLKNLIGKRIEKMLKLGLIAETNNLHQNGTSWKRIDELGFEYKYPAMFIRKEIIRDEMKNLMLTANYQYAKRQMTWFKKYAPKTHWLEGKEKIGGKKEAFALAKKFLSLSVGSRTSDR